MMTLWTALQGYICSVVCDVDKKEKFCSSGAAEIHQLLDIAQAI
jgi:hypothetical protein